jgi:urocanate hydratase
VGGAQPLAITMNEGVCLAVEVDPHRIQRRLETGYCDEMASTLDEALNQVREACNLGLPLSIGLIGNAATAPPHSLRTSLRPLRSVVSLFPVCQCFDHADIGTLIEEGLLFDNIV